MSKWGWKYSVIFAISVLFATSALVAAGLADSADPTAVAKAGVR